MSEEDKLSGGMSFWEHLDALRTALIRIVIVTIAFGVVAFCFKETLFDVVLAPKDPQFVTYTVFNRIAAWAGGDLSPVSVQLISTGLAQQFVLHMKTALWAGLICGSPYVLYQLFRFVSPALYAEEKRYASTVVGGGYIMFMIGVLLNYFLFFPLTFRFLGSYQVSEEVQNLIALDSYLSTLAMMSVAMGIVFEIPVLSWLFAKMGLLKADFMRQNRKKAFVIVLIVAAVITPTSDIFTLLLVALPMWVLYEISILLVARCKPKVIGLEQEKEQKALENE